MAHITVPPLARRAYEVVIDGKIRHRVADDDLERLVQASFEFLLPREPPSSNGSGSR